MIPYGRQLIDESDIENVVDVLRSDWLTTGPKVTEFEKEISNFVNSRYAVAVNSGTSALHCAMHALNIRPGDEVIVPTITFVATANCIVYQKAKPVFVDVDNKTLNLDPDLVEKKITKNTKAIICVDYTGQPCEYDRLKKIAEDYGLYLVADACHSLGANYKGRCVGKLADITVFSFHPVKHITTGEGGMIITDKKEFYERAKCFRNHGITSDSHERSKDNTWFYEMNDIGYNYRISDIQCALGVSQLRKLKKWIKRRNEIAKIYDSYFKTVEEITPLHRISNITHAYHLYVVKIRSNRNEYYNYLRAQGIGVNVHYIPVHLQPYYRKNFNTYEGLCPVSEQAYEEILSLPIYPGLNDKHMSTIIVALKNAVNCFHAA